LVPGDGGEWLDGIRRNHVEISSVFSGIATECQVARIIADSATGGEHGVNRFVHTAVFEIHPGAREILKATVGGPVFGDIAELVPLQLRKWASSRERTFGAFRRRILEQRVPIAPVLHCHRSGVDPEWL
jgi:hypothetical protein